MSVEKSPPKVQDAQGDEQADEAGVSMFTGIAVYRDRYGSFDHSNDTAGVR